MNPFLTENSRLFVKSEIHLHVEGRLNLQQPSTHGSLSDLCGSRVKKTTFNLLFFSQSYDAGVKMIVEEGNNIGTNTRLDKSKELWDGEMRETSRTEPSRRRGESIILICGSG